MTKEYLIKNYNSAGTMTLDQYQKLTGYEEPPATENTTEPEPTT